MSTDPKFREGDRVTIASKPGAIHIVAWRGFSSGSWSYRLRGSQINYPEPELIASGPNDALEFVGMADLDTQAMGRRGWDFEMGGCYALFKCPSCDKIHLLDTEWDQVYTDAEDAGVGVDSTRGFRCACGKDLGTSLGRGVDPEPGFAVSFALLARSPWRWISPRTRNPA